MNSYYIFTISSSVEANLSYFHFPTIANSVVINTAKQISVEHDLEYFGHMSMSAACIRFLFSFLRNCHTHFRSGFLCTKVKDCFTFLSLQHHLQHQLLSGDMLILVILTKVRWNPKLVLICLAHTHTHTHTHTQRERERERYPPICMHAFMYVHMYVCMLVYT